MTKADLVERIRSVSKLSLKESTDIVDEVFSIMKDTIAAGEDIKISGFGNFEVKHKKDRKGRNPLTGESITIKERRVLTFKKSSVLKTAINVSVEE